MLPGRRCSHSRVLVGPLGDELAADFAKTAVTAEGLGRDTWPDLLSVSYSSVDAVNHFFGPSSLENEEIVRRLDRSLAEFMQFLDETVGPEWATMATQASLPVFPIRIYRDETKGKWAKHPLTRKCHILFTTRTKVLNTPAMTSEKNLLATASNAA